MARGRRDTECQAAHDEFYMHKLLEAEDEMKQLGRSQLLELLTVPRSCRVRKCDIHAAGKWASARQLPTLSTQSLSLARPYSLISSNFSRVTRSV